MAAGDLELAEIIDRLLLRLDASYVFPEVASRIGQRVRTRLAQGEYDRLTTGEELRDAITSDLQEVSRDRHLKVRYYPAPQLLREGDAWADPEFLAAWKIEAALTDNYGVHKVERLRGPVGYIELTAVDEAEYTAEVAAAAMGLVANTSALILDLRRNTGGAPTGVAFWCSYFFPPEPVHLNDVYCRAGDRTQQYWTLPHLPGRRYLEKPVYVLTSGRTFSGAEELAYNLKALERATLVGERTLGGANPVELHQLSPFFDVLLPTCRSINPITGTNWEGVGVEPHIAVPAAEALATAHAHALGTVLAGLGDDPTGPHAALAAEARTALTELWSRDGGDAASGGVTSGP